MCLVVLHYNHSRKVCDMFTRQVVSFRMYPADIAAFKAKAKELGTTPAEILRIAVTKVNERDVADRQKLLEIAHR